MCVVSQLNFQQWDVSHNTGLLHRRRFYSSSEEKVTNVASMSEQTAEFDKRDYPRVHLFRPLKLSDGDGNTIEANLRDLSPCGLQAVTDKQTANALMATFSADDDTSDTRLTTQFTLPVDEKFHDIVAHCRLVHVSEVPDEGIAIGVNFVHCRDADLAHLKRFILCSLEPA